jgi:hypothetical protein
VRKIALSAGALFFVGMLAVPALVRQAPARAAQPVRLVSGFQPGEFTPPFEVVDVTGPNKGRTLCYR